MAGVQLCIHNPNPGVKSQSWRNASTMAIDAMKLLAKLELIFILSHFLHCTVYAKCAGDL